MQFRLMFRHAFSILLFLTLITSLNVGLTAQASPDASALIAVFVTTAETPGSIETLGLPIYQHVHSSQAGEFFLMGAKISQLNRLTDAGISYQMLDNDIQAKSYYLAYSPIGRPAPDWTAYGEVLLDGGSVVVLQAAPRQAEKLPDTGVELATITLSPLSPAAPSKANFPTNITPDALIQNMIDQVTQTNVLSYTGNLSGEWPVIVGGLPYTILTRNTNSGVAIQKATQFVGEHMERLGLDVEYHQWGGATYPNVIGEIPGLINPQDIYIIGAHLDDMPSSGRAPGADDNASGSVATLLAADILSQYQWGCTLRFALWTGEEQGLNGSQAYAQRAHNAGENILGYLNLDMIAWNNGSSAPGVDVLYNSSMPSTLQLGQLFVDTVSAYNLNLTPQLLTSLGGGSDHSSFWDQGYTAILTIEDQDDFNPYYHTVNDDMNNFEDWPYYVEFVRASIATFAHMSGCLIPSGLGAMDGIVTDAGNSQPIENASITFSNDIGQNLTADTNATGYYTRTLVAGSYTVTAEAYGYTSITIGNLSVLTDSLTTQNFALTTAPTYTVSGQVSDLTNGLPLLAQVTFENSPVSVWTNPVDGSYQSVLPTGLYTMRVQAFGHRPQERAINLTSNQTQNFQLETLSCILLVDDDANTPNVQSYYTTALDALELDYDLRDITSQGEPTLNDLAGYRHIIWFTGEDYGGTLTSDNESNLSSYLNSGGNLFLSAQDYLYERGRTTFGQNYLHLASFSNDVNQTTVSGVNVFQGLGPYPLTYPFTNYSDIVQPDSVARSAFTGNRGTAAISYDGEAFNTVFLGYPLEAVSSAGRQAILTRTLEFFGGCTPANGSIAGNVTDAQTGEGLANVALNVTPGNLATNTNSQGDYSLSLPPATYTLTAQHACYISETVASIVVSENLTTTQNIALQPLPPVAHITPGPTQFELIAGSSTTSTIAIENSGCSSLTYTATNTTNAPWISIQPITGTLETSENSTLALDINTTGMAAGIYTATVAIQTNDPEQAITAIPMTLTLQAPCFPVSELDFTWEPITPTIGTDVTFTASLTGTQPITLTWLLGEQVIGSGEIVTASFNSAGEQTVSLYASNTCSANVQVSHQLVVLLRKIFLPLILSSSQQ